MATCAEATERLAEAASAMESHLAALAGMLREQVGEATEAAQVELAEAASEGGELLKAAFEDFSEQAEASVQTLQETATALREASQRGAQDLQTRLTSVQTGLAGLLAGEMTRLTSEFGDAYWKLEQDVAELKTGFESVKRVFATTTADVEVAVEGVTVAADSATTGLDAAIGAFESVRKLCEEIEDAFG
jgi:hypothetical protein